MMFNRNLNYTMNVDTVQSLRPVQKMQFMSAPFPMDKLAEDVFKLCDILLDKVQLFIPCSVMYTFILYYSVES